MPSWIVYGFQFVAIGAWTAYAVVYFEAMGIDIALIGVLAAVPAVVAILASPAWGLVADRMGDMRVPYLVAALWAALAAVGLATAPGMPWLAVAVLMLSLGAAGLTPLIDARTIQRLWPRRERFGQARVAGSIAFMAGTIGTGILVAASDLRVMFMVYAVAMTAAGIAAVALLGRPRGARKVGGVGPRAATGLLRLPGLALFFAGSCVMWTAAVGSMTLFSLRIIELGGDTRLVGIGWATSALFEVPMMILFARFAARIGVERLIVVGALLFVVRAATWTVADSPLTFIAFTALGGSGYALAMVGNHQLRGGARARASAGDGPGPVREHGVRHRDDRRSHHGWTGGRNRRAVGGVSGGRRDRRSGCRDGLGGDRPEAGRGQPGEGPARDVGRGSGPRHGLPHGRSVRGAAGARLGRSRRPPGRSRRPPTGVARGSGTPPPAGRLIARHPSPPRRAATPAGPGTPRAAAPGHARTADRLPRATPGVATRPCAGPLGGPFDASGRRFARCRGHMAGTHVRGVRCVRWKPPSVDPRRRMGRQAAAHRERGRGIPQGTRSLSMRRTSSISAARDSSARPATTSSSASMSGSARDT